MRKLGIDTIDLFILHQALPGEPTRTVNAYRALQRLLADGQVRAIGVSNFIPPRLQALMNETEIIPAINQVELHPYYTQADVQQEDQTHGIVTQAWSPIGGITAYRGQAGAARTFDDPAIRGIADQHGKTRPNPSSAEHR